MTTTLTNPVFKETNPYLAQFERWEAGELEKLPAWVRETRRTGIAHFAEAGFPTLHQEDWRFTNVAPIVQLPFKPVMQHRRHGLSPEGLKRFLFGNPGYPRLVFLDGHYCVELSTVNARPGGIKVGSLASALPIDAAIIARHLARHASPRANAFVALNTAFFQDGAFILLPPGTVLNEPIHLLFIATSAETGASTHPRNLIIAQKNSQAVIIEHYVNWAEGTYFTNSVTELALGEGAVVEHCKIQNESRTAFHMATIEAHQERGSRFISHAISLGARWARNDIRSEMAGEQSDCLLNGLYLADGEQLVDHHTTIDHTQPHCTSNEFYHGIVDGRAKAVFNGKIFVRRDAQKTEAKQTNRNLLLSEDATIDTKPQLEIFADDVKCTHGATVGQLNEESIFYFRSRGIGLESARKMLIHAFGRQITERIRLEDVRAHVDRLLSDRLSKCISVQALAE